MCCGPNVVAVTLLHACRELEQKSMKCHKTITRLYPLKTQSLCQGHQNTLRSVKVN